MRNEIHFVSPVIISCHSVIIVLSPPPYRVLSVSHPHLADVHFRWCGRRNVIAHQFPFRLRPDPIHSITEIKRINTYKQNGGGGTRGGEERESSSIRYVTLETKTQHNSTKGGAPINNVIG